METFWIAFIAVGLAAVVIVSSRTRRGSAGPSLRPAQWRSRETSLDGAPAVVWVDDRFAEGTLQESHPVRAWMDVAVRDPGGDGLGAPEEGFRVQELSARLGISVGGERRLVPVGRIRHANRTRVVYYTRDLAQFEACAARFAASVPGAELTFGAEDDPEWSFYREFLLPGAAI